MFDFIDILFASAPLLVEGSGPAEQIKWWFIGWCMGIVTCALGQLVRFIRAAGAASPDL